MNPAPVRRFLCSIAAALALGANAFAQQAAPSNPTPPTFALLSLVGDQFSVVVRRQELGSRIDPNDRREYPLGVAMLDDLAMSAAEDVIKKLRPASPVLRFSIRDPRLFALQDKLLVDGTESRQMREALAKLLRDNGATRLVLVTKLRDEAQFKTLHGATGSGKISGLGFYVDPFIRVRLVETGEATEGFLGPYAYISVAVVDVASMAVIRSAQARQADAALPLNGTGAVRAWEALTPEGKVEALERVLRGAVQSATATALAD
jgi:hypothetical protein